MMACNNKIYLVRTKSKVTVFEAADPSLTCKLILVFLELV